MNSFASGKLGTPMVFLISVGAAFLLGAKWGGISKLPPEMETAVPISSESPPEDFRSEPTSGIKSPEIDQIWSSLESFEDLGLAAELLKNMGFPHQARHGILYQLAVDKRAEERLAIEHPDGLNWWETPPSQTQEGKGRIMGIMMGADLEARDALGPNFEPTEFERRQMFRHYGITSPEKAAELELIEQEMAAARMIYSESSDPSAMTVWDETMQELTDSLEQLLTPRELQEYRIRRSASTQDTIRHLAGVEVSAEKFTQIAIAQTEAHEAFRDLDPAVRADFLHKRIAYAEADFETLNVLGPERFVQHQTNKDPQFSYAVALVEAQGLPAASAVGLWEIQARTLQAMSDSEQPLNQQQLNVLVEEANQSIRTKFGVDIYRAYRASGASLWLGKLERLTIDDGG
ncbi:hypothetical protein N9Z12_00860 [Opitutaceae bacterium]|nr:hypothetical protein [Opitutaceae bacterium]